MSIDFNKAREQVLLALHDKRGEWINAKMLAARGGYSATNQQVALREQISIAVKNGAPIISGAKGYMWAVQPNQLKRYAARLRKRAYEINERATNVEVILKKWSQSE